MGRTAVEPEVRFDAKVVKTESCWLWRGAKSRNGYAQFRTGGVGAPQALVHRWNYERFKGAIPDGYQVDHLCKTRLCVNPDHLEAVPPALNNARSESPTAINGRMVLCAQDLHELNGENLEPTALRHGQRRCRECKKQWQAAYRQRRRENRQ